MKKILPFILLIIAFSLSIYAIEPEILSGNSIPNPGNGFFRVQNQSAGGFSSVTIQQLDPDISLSGTLTFKMGAFEAVIDLGAGDRHLQIGRNVPFLDVTIAGVDTTAQFSIILL